MGAEYIIIFKEARRGEANEGDAGTWKFNGRKIRLSSAVERLLQFEDNNMDVEEGEYRGCDFGVGWHI